MSDQAFHPWEPFPGIPKKMNLERLCEDHEGLNIVLRVEGTPLRYLRMSFEGDVSYRSTDEGDLLKTIGPSHVGHVLFTVEDSEFLAWLHDQSLGIRSAFSNIHYAIYTPNRCIDVISITPPTTEWTEQAAKRRRTGEETRQNQN